MAKVKNLKYLVRVLLTPTCWIRNERTNNVWDRELNQLMEKYDFQPITGYTARLGPVELWVANHPYASFTLRNQTFLPKRTTVLRAYDKYVADLIQYHLTHSKYSAPSTLPDDEEV